MVFFLLLLVPLIVAGVAYAFLHERITLTELAIQVFALLLVTFASQCAIYRQNVDDVETLNGQVTEKHSERVGCRHSYQCNCYEVCTGSGNNRSCSTHCSTCYEHSYDVDWVLTTSIPSEIQINTIDRQGIYEPPRWTRAKVGDPVADHNTYENYIKAASGTLFKHEALIDRYRKALPPYPDTIYDYHYEDRFVSYVRFDDVAQIQRRLSEMNSRLQSHKANAIIVVVKKQPREYAEALEQYWIGGKKNDAILVVSVDDSMHVQWAHVISWTKRELFKVKLRNAVASMETFDPYVIMDVVERAMPGFEHRSMHDFEYLKASITPTTLQWVIAMLIGIVISIGLTIFMAHEDVHICVMGSDP